jgi:hypothetical protein
MDKKKRSVKWAAVIICLLIIINAAACGGTPSSTETEDTPPSVTDDETPPIQTPTDEPPDTPVVPPTDTPKPTPDPEPTPNLVPYDGVVEHLFFHEVIAYPELAFDGDSMQSGYDENMVTVSEYNKMLRSIYDKGFILVDLNDVWSEYTDENGAQQMKKNTLMLPEGKKPLVLSYDDISFYEYMRGDGFMEKLFIGDDGEIWASGIDPSGAAVISQDLTVVTILDKFVKEHPDFSLGGVKGCIALTGYEGILGYRTHTDRKNDTAEFRLNRMQEVARVRPVVQKLKETGWYFATHSYGHINLNKASLSSVTGDAQRWLDEVGSLVGETQLFIYPFGSRLDGSDVYNTGPAFKAYHDLGFRIFASVGIEPFSRIKSDIPAVVCDRMHADGGTLRRERERYLKFYDASSVFDPARP